MTRYNKQSKDSTTSPRRPGVRARLLLAFLAITAFTAMAAVAGIYAFREVGERLGVVETRVGPAITALELSSSAERIIAAAPALLAATRRQRRDEVRAELVGEVDVLNGALADLSAEAGDSLPLGNLASLVSSLTTALDALDAAAQQRIESGERLDTLRATLFDANTAIRRLLAPWLEVLDGEITARVEALPNHAVTGEPAAGLAAQIAMQRRIEAVQNHASTIVDRLGEASTANRPKHLPVLHFQVGLALDNLADSAAGLDPRLRSLLDEQVTTLNELTGGTDSIAGTRGRELALIAEGERRLAETARLAAELTRAVDRLAEAAKDDAADAVADALGLQRTGARVLVALALLGVITALLIVWLYVGGNIVRRLTALSDRALAIAGGRLSAPVDVEGSDEIAAMARAVETFRRNAIELEKLLAEREQTAVRLESLVEERTRDLSDKTRQLETANRYKSHFLASASHDMRQPLHALNLFIAQLEAEHEPEARARLLGRVDTAVDSMNELFGSLLDMSRLEAGILEPQVSSFGMDRVLEQIETTFLATARDKALRLDVMPTRAAVTSDPVLLERILINLVSNAIRYTDAGGVVVGCRRAGNALRIDVCDTGPGIAPERQRDVFTEYYRLDNTAGGGFGLGLAIVERLARLLGHPLVLESDPGRGSRFSVTVPRAYDIAQYTATPVAPADPARGKLVVVIDDDPLVLDGMTGMLGDWGCEVVAAGSAAVALAESGRRARRPDLVICDYRLGGNGNGSGIEAIAELRGAAGAEVPAFLISGDTAPSTLRHAREHGIHLLAKPVPPMQLRALVNRLLAGGDRADS